MARFRWTANDLARPVDDGWLTARRHPTEPLTIYNYTARCQYDRHWTPITRACRGIILHDDGRVIARPFPKFFNLEEMPGSWRPKPPFSMTEKMDGCFPSGTPLNLWGGGTVTIGEVVRHKLRPVLVGRDERGRVVPCEVVDHFDNGTKDAWLDIEVDCLVSPRKSGCRTGNRLRVTPNHHVFVNGAFRPASDVRPGDELTTFVDRPSPGVLHMLRSALLGDGSLSGRGKATRFYEGHKRDHKEYIDAVRLWLGACGVRGRVLTSGYGSTIDAICSKTYLSLAELRAEWYPDGSKCLPADLSWVDDFSIAKWYMDDGHLIHHANQQDRAGLSTHAFPEDDVRRLAALLEQRYRVSCTVYHDKGWVIRINAGRDRAIERFWATISPHMVPCMRYKLPERYRDVPYVERPEGTEERIATPARVLCVTVVPPTKNHFPSGRVGFDIQTTTGNYHAKGVLVHNSLGLLYRASDGLRIATRGSFVSPQAEFATALLIERGYDGLPWDTDRFTYLFEIISPRHRIVVDYGGQERLVLLAAIETATGKDAPLPDWYPDRVREYPWEGSIEVLGALAVPNAEGYVVRCGDGTRVKIKFEEYKRAHRLIFGLSARTIWKRLSQDQPLDDLLEHVPDELYGWVKGMETRLDAEFTGIKRRCRIMADALAPLPRREQALQLVDVPERAVIFNMLDGKPYDQAIWRMIKPSGKEAFRMIGEDAE
jgi:RNA ligase